MKKVAKDGVHACVLRIFFCASLLLSSLNKKDDVAAKKQLLTTRLAKSLIFIVFSFEKLCENRQQPT